MTDLVYGSLLDIEYDEMVREASILIFDQHFSIGEADKHKPAYAGCCNVYGAKRNLMKRHIQETMMTYAELKKEGVVSAAGLYRFTTKQTEKVERWSVWLPRLHGDCEALAQR